MHKRYGLNTGIEYTIFWIHMLKIIDPKYPVVYTDEKPKQLLDDRRKSIPMKYRPSERYDYKYKRNGKSHIFVAVDYQKFLIFVIMKIFDFQ
ncbi:MAG: hypothetical protein LBD03_00055 [Methanobrevibacter sp.]|jgi:hypothetical protein|nr:hypothetical protein [Candidatus Methanovirga procula]